MFEAYLELRGLCNLQISQYEFELASSGPKRKFGIHWLLSCVLLRCTPTNLGDELLLSLASARKITFGFTVKAAPPWPSPNTVWNLSFFFFECKQREDKVFKTFEKNIMGLNREVTSLHRRQLSSARVKTGLAKWLRPRVKQSSKCNQ